MLLVAVALTVINSIHLIMLLVAVALASDLAFDLALLLICNKELNFVIKSLILC